jgi:hypothetical protein
MAEKWIAGAIKHPGALHKELGVPEGKKIPEKKIKAAEHSGNPTEEKRARLAETLKGFHHDGGGKHAAGRKSEEKREGAPNRGPTYGEPFKGSKGEKFLGAPMHKVMGKKK